MNGCDKGFEGLDCTKGRVKFYSNIFLKKKTYIGVIDNVVFALKLFANVFNCYVYSECNDGYFGPNCIEPCNVTCRSCNKTSGICDKGCKPGWRGLYCQEGMFLSVSFNTNGIFSYLYPSCKQNLRNSKLPCFHSFNFYNKMIQDLNFLQLLKFLCKYFFTQLLILFFLYNPILFLKY